MPKDWTKDSRCKYAYLFKEGSGGTVTDLSGNGNTGTFKSVTEPQWSTFVPTFGLNGKANASVLYDNVNDYLSCGTSDVVTENSAITFVCWFYQIGAGVNERLFQRNSVLFYADQGGDGKALIFEVDGSVNGMRPTTNATLAYGVWQHIALTWTGSTTMTNAHIYKNGVEVSYGSATNITTPTDNSGSTLFIGNNNASPSDRPINGYLAEVGIFNAVLALSEIQDIYNYGLQSNVGILNLKRGIW